MDVVVAHMHPRGSRYTRGTYYDDLPLAFAVEVNPTDRPLHLVEANIVESLETRACNGPHSMVRHKEVLFPPHKDVFALRDVFHNDMRGPGCAPCLLSVRPEGRKLGPVG